MKVFSKRIVIRHGSLRIVALLCCLIGILAVWNWKDAPNEAVFEVQVIPEFSKTRAKILKSVIQNRDLSKYDLGETISDCFETETYDQCVNSFEKGREFIYEHFKSKKRGFIVYEWTGVDNGGEIYIFIEPDENGIWHIVKKQEQLYSYNIESLSAVSIKRKQKNEDDYRRRVGKFYLSFLDAEGEIILEL